MLHVVLVSKNKSIYVKTLHSILGIEAMCNHAGLQLDITFVNDDSVDKMDLLKKKLKSADRIFWVEYGVSVDKDSLMNSVIKYDNHDGLVFPVVKEGIDWDMFKQKCKDNSNEPAEQCGLTFDTTVSSKVINKDRNLYEVTKTQPSCWVLDCKRVMKKLVDKGKKKDIVFPATVGQFFDKCIDKNVKLAAAVNSVTYNHFTHECVGNIMNIPGIKVT